MARTAKVIRSVGGAPRERSDDPHLRIKQLEGALDNMPQGLCMFDAERRLIVCNRLYADIFGLPPELTTAGTSLLDILTYRVETGLFPGDDGPAYIRNRLEVADRATRSTSILELKDGRIFSVAHEPMRGGGWVSTHEDITERVRVADELRRAREFLDQIIESVPEAILVKNANDRRFTLLNRAAEEFLGMSRADVIGKTAAQIYPEESAKRIAKHDDELVRSGSIFIDNHMLESPTKGRRRVTLTRKRLQGADNEPRHLLTVIQDLTERRRFEERIVHLAHHDPLTDLPNRALFNERLAAARSNAIGSGGRFAVACIDVDRLKETNDVFGHAAGDRLLCEMSRRLLAVAGDAFLARVGGDEFALILENVAEVSDIEALTDRLLAIVDNDFDLQDIHVRAGLSIGVAIFPEDADNTATLLANADAALYRAKAEGRGVTRFFKAEMDKRLRERHALRHDLRSAIEHGELEVFYQPQAEASRKIVGFEALLRWRHPSRGWVSPTTFIPVAEESRLIIGIGEWVLREVCREAASWPRHLSVAINLSPIQFQHGDLAHLVHAILLQTGLEASRLELEITEGVLIADSTRALSMLRRLKALGVRIVMDDFGSGYSSLSYLQSFPFDKIKIDRAFVSKVQRNAQSAAIIRAVLGLARGLNLPVVAEGVETDEELAFLAREGCDQLQGYLIGKPLPIANYAAVIGRSASTLELARQAGP